jgi:hypothetical protein
MKGHFAITLPVASQRFENAMRQPRSIPQAGGLLRHLRMEQDNPSVFDLLVGDGERAVALRVGQITMPSLDAQAP